MIEARHEWFYLHRHPITDEVSVRSQEFLWIDGYWQLPDYQTAVPNIVEGTEFYWDEEEARGVLRKWENGQLERESEGVE